MLAILGAECLALITKEIVKHGPEITDAVMKELEVVASSLFKYMTDSMNGEVAKLEKK